MLTVGKSKLISVSVFFNLPNYLSNYFLCSSFGCRSITSLSALLEAEDRAVRIAAGEALVLCFELKLLDVFSNEEDEVETREASGSKNQLFLNMQALKAKISGLVYNLSMEAGGKGADKKNLNDQRELFQRISDFIKV